MQTTLFNGFSVFFFTGALCSSLKKQLEEMTRISGNSGALVPGLGHLVTKISCPTNKMVSRIDDCAEDGGRGGGGGRRGLIFMWFSPWSFEAITHSLAPRFVSRQNQK